MDTQRLARGVISGLVIAQVEATAKRAVVVAAAVGALAVLASFWVSNLTRVVLGLVIVVALAVLIGTVAARWIAVKGIRRFAEPGQIGQYRTAIDRAIDQAELPSGPFGAIKLVWRLRRGVGPEIARFQEIVSDLSVELNRETKP